MASRNNPGVDEDSLLDAARDRIAAVGLRRTTITDIARRAGVSRMTIYRRWPDMASLLADVMTREAMALVSAMGSVPGEHVRARLIAAIVEGVRTMRAHAMFRRIVELDPETLLPYLVERLGTSQRLMTTQIARELALGQADGSIRQGDVTTLAVSVLLTVQAFTLSGPITGVDLDALDRELATLLDGYMAP